jgi:hypothetical protein
MEAPRRAGMAARKPITDAVISELASLAKIPPVHETLLNSFICIDVDMIWKIEALSAWDLKGSPKLIAQASRDLKKALGEASEGAKELIIWHLAFQSSPAPHTLLDDYQIMVTRLAAAAGSAAHTSDGSDIRPYNRATGGAMVRNRKSRRH